MTWGGGNTYIGLQRAFRQPGFIVKEKSAALRHGSRQQNGKKKNTLTIFHFETWKAQYVQQSFPFKSSHSVRDKHAAAFRDDSEMYYALTRERGSWLRLMCCFTPSETDFLFCSTCFRPIRISRLGLNREGATVGIKKKSHK